MLRLFSRLAPALFLALVSCEGAVAPLPTRFVTFRICDVAQPIDSFMHLNERSDWQVVEGHGKEFSFEATERVVIALKYRYSEGHNFSTLVTIHATRAMYVTSHQIAQHSCWRQTGAGSKQLTGTMTPSSTWTRVSMGPAYAFVSSGDTTYSLTGIPDGPIDFVAATGLGHTVPERVIVRRGLQPDSGSALQIVDFSGDEAVPLDSAPVSVPGFSANNSTVGFTLLSATTAFHLYGYGGSQAASPMQLYGVPPEALGPDAVNQLGITSAGSAHLRHYYTSVSPTTLPLGPQLSVPAGSVSPGPCPSVSVTIPPHAEYPDAALARFSATIGSRDVARIEVWVTREYLGQSGAGWNLGTVMECPFGATPPNFREPGLDEIAQFDGNVFLLLGSRPTAGETIRWATKGTR